MVVYYKYLIRGPTLGQKCSRHKDEVCFLVVTCIYFKNRCQEKEALPVFCFLFRLPKNLWFFFFCHKSQFFFFCHFFFLFFFFFRERGGARRVWACAGGLTPPCEICIIQTFNFVSEEQQEHTPRTRDWLHQLSICRLRHDRSIQLTPISSKEITGNPQLT